MTEATGPRSTLVSRQVTNMPLTHQAAHPPTCRYCAAWPCVTCSCPLGLACSVAMRASSRLGPMPALAVHPVAASTSARMAAAMAAGSPRPAGPEAGGVGGWRWRPGDGLGVTYASEYYIQRRWEVQEEAVDCGNKAQRPAST